MKLTETEVRAPETKPSKEGKEMLPFVTQYQTLLSVYSKRSFNGKVESHTKPTATLLFF